MGFTLLELMIAMSVLSIALVSIYKLQGQSVYMMSTVRFYTTAPLLAREKMSEFETLKKEDLDSDSGDFGDEFPDFSWNSEVEDAEWESEDYQFIPDNLKKIYLTVSWGDDMLTYSIWSYVLFAEDK